MSNLKQTNGIKRAHNGAIGESRTKSFLMDRFWILERSVDIEGADFIIQRKLQGHSILDNKPPRFGIIQSKFSQDEQTSHKLNRDYVVDKSGKPYMEFFLIVNIGYEDSQKMCLLSAKDIIDNFKPNESNRYLISTKKAIQDFLIINKKQSLDYIESSVQCAEFYKNRTYVFSELNSVKPDLNAIHPDFTRDVDYTDGNIPDLFREQKVEAYDFILEIEKIHAQLLSFVQEINPIESCSIAEIFNNYFGGEIKIPQIFNENFYYKAKGYFEQINYLKDDRILDNYLSLKELIRNNVNDFLTSNICKVDLTSQHIISIKYNPIDLSDLQVNNEITSIGHSFSDYYKYLYLKEGEIKISIKIGLHVRNDNLTPYINDCCLIDIMEKIYELKYFEINNKA